MTQSPEDRRPMVEDVDPDALAVNSVDDEVRLHADPSETSIVDSGGETVPVEENSEGNRVQPPSASDSPRSGSVVEPESNDAERGGATGVTASRPLDDVEKGQEDEP